MAIKVITDSSCDLPEELVRTHDIEIVPLKVSFADDDRVYLDRVEMSAREFWRRLQDSRELPRTSAPDPQSLMDAFERWVKEKGEVVFITISSGLSSTYQTAIMAREMLSADIRTKVRVVDSLTASMGVGILALKAAEYVRQGQNLETVVKKVEEYRDALETLFTLNTLENIVKGGRLSRISGVVGSLLDIKPVFRGVNGKVEVFEKIRGRRKSLNRLIQLAGEMGKTAAGRVVGISHVDCREDVDYLVAKIRTLYQPAEIIVSDMSGTVGTYAGKGGILLHF